MRSEQLRCVALRALCGLIALTVLFISLDRASASYFVSRQDFNGGVNTQSVVVEDFTNDGLPDVAAANLDRVILLRGSGSTTLSPFETIAARTFPEIMAANYLAAGDFNEDGNLDLVVSEYSTVFLANRVTVLLGDGTGVFAESPTTYTPEFAPSGLVCTDFNNDGRFDLATANFLDDTVRHQRRREGPLAACHYYARA